MFNFKKLFAKKGQKSDNLLEEIKKASDWAVENLSASGYVADYGFGSIVELDRFIEKEKFGVLQQEDREIIFFALGSYLGETLLSLYEAEWVTDENDDKSKLNIAIKLDQNTYFYPVQACFNRYQKGSAASFYGQLLNLLAETEDSVSGVDKENSDDLNLEIETIPEQDTLQNQLDEVE